jgi:hypothetical protein
MRLVVAKTTPKKQITTEDKIVDTDAKEVNPDILRPANLNRLENLQQLKMSPANLNRFEKWSENLKSKKTNPVTSTATSLPPTTTSSPHHHNHHRNQTSATPNPSTTITTSTPHHRQKQANVETRSAAQLKAQQIRHQHTNSGDTKPEHATNNRHLNLHPNTSISRASILHLRNKY